MTGVDQPGELRTEDAFDVAAVHSWLADQIPGLPSEPPEVRQYPGGASNLTYLLRYPDRELILRRPPAGHKAASAHDMRREFRVQRGLKPVFPYVPTVIGFCDDHAVLGSEFYVMERIQGIILRSDLPDGLTVTSGEAAELGRRLIERLAELHRVDPAAAGLTELGKGAGYVRRQVEGWTRRYRAARTENVPDLEEVMAWLAEHQVDDVRTCVIHNDWRFDNAVLSDDLDIIGVLDWEMATLGDPLMDLGGTLAYWVQADDDDVYQLARRQPSNLPGMPTRRELWDGYCALMDLPTENYGFYQAFGLFRLAVIMQQIYYRFHNGQTTNPKFKDYWMFVGYLEWRCRQVIEHGGL
jgi:aminoglycoside phosphotransferase (APT) family kinase protein